MPENLRGEIPELNHEPAVPLGERAADKITEEHLFAESGRLKYERILELEQKFRDALRVVEKREYDTEDSEAYYDAIYEMNFAFNEAATVLLNTLDQHKSRMVTDIVFRNLNRLLSKASEYDEEIYSLFDIYDRVIQNFPRIAAEMNEGGMEPLEAVALIGNSEIDDQSQKAMGFLNNQLPAINSYLRVDTPLGREPEVRVVFPALEALLENSTREVKSEVLYMLQWLLSDLETSDTAAEIIEKMLSTSPVSEELEGYAVDIIQSTLVKFGIDSETAFKWIFEWTTYQKPKGFVVRKNIEAVVRLENEKKGITTILFEKYGILNFGRYPVAMLLRQYENMNNKDNPYGVIIYPKGDHNGAFHGDEFVFTSLNFEMALDENLRKYLIRIYECGSKKDIAKALIDLDAAYGQSHKISFAIIGGHGSKDSINFGFGSSKRNSLYSSDLHRSRVQKTGDFFEPDATIVLVSCSTGENEGIAQTLTEKMGMKVIAPNVPTNIVRITPKFKDGKIDFDAEYTDKNSDQVYVRPKTPKPA